MARGRGQLLCAVWGGISLGVGTLAYALFSSSSAGCSTNLVVLTRSAVTARGCAVFSIVAHVGVGLMVLGAVLLLGSFALAVRTRRQSVVAVGPAEVSPAVAAGRSAAAARREPARLLGPETTPSTAPTPPVRRTAAPSAPSEARPAPVAPAVRTSTGRPQRAGPTLTVESALGVESGDGSTRPPGPPGSAMRLPPGWYGNPNIPGKPVQWWDGTKLVDDPED
jgi:hypothetical protein